MIVGITGHEGFIAKNLKEYLVSKGHKFMNLYIDEHSIYYDDDFDCVVHLMGRNKGEDENISSTNVGGTLYVANFCKSRMIKMINVSSTYPHKSMYRASKKIGEEIVNQYVDNFGCDFYNLVLPKVIGKYCKPNYNSFVTTLIYNHNHGIPYLHMVKDLNEVLELVHVDYVCELILDVLEKPRGYFGAGTDVDWIKESFDITFREIIDILNGKDHKYAPMFNKLVEHYKNVE